MASRSDTHGTRQLPVLTGPRVVLRAPTIADRDARTALGRHPEVVRGFGGAEADRSTLRPDELDRWWHRLTTATHGWVIEFGGRFVGEIRLDNVDLAEETADLAVGVFDGALLGIGLGSEAILVLLHHAFATLGLERVALHVLATNERAIRCYRSCGFSEEGRLRASAVIDGERQDELLMGILRGEFLGRFESAEDRSGPVAEELDSQRRAWIATLPRKRMASAALIRDDADQVLVVEPTYRRSWMVPGGVVEEGESPRAGCEREITEELGIELVLGDLLCVHYQPSRPDASESVMFVFGGGMHPASWFDQIRLRDTELRSWKLVTFDELRDYVPQRLARRLLHARRAAEGEPVYLEDAE